MSILKTTKQQLINNDYQLLFSQIDQYFSSSHNVLHNARNKIKEVDFNREPLIVKSFKKPSLIRSFIYSYLAPSKAKRAYNFGLKIAPFTPAVIGYIEDYNYGLLGNSYLINKKFDADFTIRPVLLDDNFPDREIIFKSFAEFVYQLHQYNVFHKDLSPGNILIKKRQQEYEFKIVDINRMRFKPLSLKSRAKNFNKLWANDADLTLMLKAYAGFSQIDEAVFVCLGVRYNNNNKNNKTRKHKIKRTLRL
jgi:hypothetical protein